MSDTKVLYPKLAPLSVTRILSFPDSKIVMVEAPAREYQEVLSGRADVSLTSKVD